MHLLTRRAAAAVFLAFAFAYFLSALLRAITATLAPLLEAQFALHARDLGLLAGGYFLGFSLTQLPLGRWLDRHGPRRVLLGFLGIAVLGCTVFALAEGFSGLLAGRVLCGMGVSACLMAPLTGFRRWLGVEAQLRANAWMLMTGSLGMVAATLPVQWLLPLVGWRALFWLLAVLLLLAMVWLALQIPAWPRVARADEGADEGAGDDGGYRAVWRHPYFQRVAPLGFFVYGGMIAVQTLWAAPWMQHVAGYPALAVATGLFGINLAMLCTFWLWGVASPWLLRRVGSAEPVMRASLPVSLIVLAAIVVRGEGAGALAWALYCVSCTSVTLSLPALAQAFDARLAGRALSAYNLVIFTGVFAIQWAIGLLLDGFAALGLSTLATYRAAFAVYGACTVAAYVWFVLRPCRRVG